MYYEYQDRAAGPQPEAPKKRRRGAAKFVAVALACVLTGGAGGAATYFALGGAAAQAPGAPSAILESGRESVVVTEQVKSAGETLALPEIYAKYVHSTVGVATEITTANIFGEPTSAAAAGSGFFITSDGYVLTNYHVIEKASRITVTCYDGTEYPAKLAGADADNDIAVLKVEASGIAPVVIGKSGALRVGEEVAAIGNPLGELTFTFTNGIVSALDRAVTTSDGTVFNMIQTNCAVNSGNSGGPLFNAYGEVIGIVSAKYASAGVEGLSFAIPIDRVIDMVSGIMQFGYVPGKPYMGITVATVSSQDAARYNLTVGAYVNSVAAGSCAEKAGLRQGDVITAMEDKKVTSQGDLIALKNTHRAGDTVSLAVIRAGETLTLTLTFDEQTPESEAANSPASAQESGRKTPQESDSRRQNTADSRREYFQNPWGSQYGTNGGTIY